MCDIVKNIYNILWTPKKTGFYKKRGGAQDNYEGFTITIYWR